MALASEEICDIDICDIDEDIEVTDDLFQEEEGEEVVVEEDDISEEEEINLHKIPSIVFVNEDHVANVVTSNALFTNILKQVIKKTFPSVQSTTVLKCSKCEKCYKREGNLEKHLEICKGSFHCF